MGRSFPDTRSIFDQDCLDRSSVPGLIRMLLLPTICWIPLDPGKTPWFDSICQLGSTFMVLCCADCDGKCLLRVFPKVNPSVVDFAHPMRNRITNFGDAKKKLETSLSLESFKPAIAIDGSRSRQES
jgi:hypothetical protein